MEQNDDIVGNCVRCAKNALRVCERCGDFYCTTECQRLDWMKHRHICFAMPALVRAVAHVGFFDSSSIAASSVEQAEVNHVLNNTKEQMPGLNDEKVQKKKKRKPIHSDEKESIQPQNVLFDEDLPVQRKVPDFDKVSDNNGFPNDGNSTNDKRISKAIPTLADGSRVALMGFYATNRVYVRSAARDDDTEYKRVVNKISEEGSKAQCLREPPKQFDHVLTTLNQNDGSRIIARAKIINVHPNNQFRVVFTDFGIPSDRQLSDLRFAPEELLKLPEYVKLVQLRGLENIGKNQDFKSLMSKLKNGEYIIKYGESDENGGKVELVYPDTGNTLNNDLQKLLQNVSARGGVQSSRQIHSSTNNYNNNNENKNNRSFDNKMTDSRRARPKLNPFKHENIKTDQVSKNFSGNKFQDRMKSEQKEPSVEMQKSPPATVQQKKKDELKSQSVATPAPPAPSAPFKVVVPDSKPSSKTLVVLDDSDLENGKFGAIEANYLPLIQNILSKLLSFEPPEEFYRPKINEYVIAKFQDDWYRAKVINQQSDKNNYLVNFIDFQNEAIVSIKEMSEYPKDLDIECRTFLCQVPGLPSKLTANQLEILKRSVPIHGQANVEVIGKIGTTILVEIPDLLEKIVLA